jgi:hypothetical protein
MSRKPMMCPTRLPLSPWVLSPFGAAAGRADPERTRTP